MKGNKGTSFAPCWHAVVQLVGNGRHIAMLVNG